MDPIKVLFVCEHNSARSQMAEAILDKFGGGRYIAESAGLEPGRLNPFAVRAMADMGIDISKNATKSVFDMYREGRLYSYVITVCDERVGTRCPTFPGITKRLNWSFPDPSTFHGTDDEKLQNTIMVRDALRAKVEEFIRDSS